MDNRMSSDQQSAFKNQHLTVRFAPSPTGYLHIGGARTALFNWLYARRHEGVFVLRIEDTDAERSSWEMVAGIVEGLRWLGLDWDEGPDVGGPHAPYFQSERLDRHRAIAEQLVATGRAYYCYCTTETLQQKRQAAESVGGGWIYDRTCCALTAGEIARLEGANEPRAIRFKVPEGRTSFTDLVHGPISFDNKNIEDFVVLRSDRQPTYHLSVVADDIDMRITHVVRGDDHISNTPKHLLLFGALEASVPEFAHVPLILGPDKKRLSKRHGATSVMEYQRLGYLPEALVNFLALLGWSPGDDRELMTRDELIAAFALEGISGGNAVFNPEKLDWFNQQYILRIPVEDLAARVEPWLRTAGLWSDDLSGRTEWLYKLLELIRSRVKRLDQFAYELRPFLAPAVDFDDAAVAKHLGKADIAGAFCALPDALAAVEPFDSASLEPVVRALAESAGVKAASLIHATRVAVTGRSVSPGLFDVMTLVGRERVLARLRAAQKFLPK
jgi:glutamyl-tRNA synthetase